MKRLVVPVLAVLAIAIGGVGTAQAASCAYSAHLGGGSLTIVVETSIRGDLEGTLRVNGSHFRSISNPHARPGTYRFRLRHVSSLSRGHTLISIYTNGGA